MSEFDGEAFIRQFNRVWQEHDLAAIDAMWTEDAIFEMSFGPELYGARATGRAAATEMAASVFAQIPDVSFEEVRHFVSPEFAVVESVQSGTPVGGARFSRQIADLLTLRDGKIAAKRTYRKAPL